MLTIEEHIKYWHDGAENDMSVADGLFGLGHFD